MKSSSKFAVAIHILVGLAVVYFRKPQQSVSSENIAWSVNTNPVVIRRILGLLKKAELVKTITGASGGTQIGKNPEDITLFDIYNAVEERTVFHSPYRTPNAECPIGANISTAIAGPLQKAEQALENALSKVTLNEITKNILEQIANKQGD